MINPYFDPADYVELDMVEAEKYNARLPAARRRDYELQLQMGPMPFDGDIERARVILLMHNPGFSEDYLASSDDDHTFFRDGWPIAALHPEAGAGNRSWYLQRLGLLVSEFGAQRVSQRIALLQMNPWASRKFDERLRLPSYSLQMSLGRSALDRGAILVVGFGLRQWSRGLEVEDGVLPRGNSSQIPYFTPKNLDKHPGLWERIKTAML